MTLEQFQALQKGDKVTGNMYGSADVGEITSVSQAGLGVSVQWGGAGPSFFVSVHSTLWMHWRKVDETHTG